MSSGNTDDTLIQLKTIYNSVDSSDLKSLHKLYHFALKKLIEDENRLRFLNPDDRLCLTKFDEGIVSTKTELEGYPLSPFYSSIANILAYLTLYGTCSIMKLPTFRTLHENENSIYRVDRLQRIIDLVISIPTMLTYWTFERFLCRMEMVLEIIGRRGTIDLLKMRKTVGSMNMFPFTRNDILRAAQELHCPPSKLTVVGRAVAKHAVRDSTKAWWGECTGTEEEKNKRGLILLEKVLDGALWINIHGLPGELPALEVRTEQGYGMRCLVEPLSFRGFLEPYFADGWMNKFRH